MAIYVMTDARRIVLSNLAIKLTSRMIQLHARTVPVTLDMMQELHLPDAADRKLLREAYTMAPRMLTTLTTIGFHVLVPDTPIPRMVAVIMTCPEGSMLVTRPFYGAINANYMERNLVSPYVEILRGPEIQVDTTEVTEWATRLVHLAARRRRALALLDEVMRRCGDTRQLVATLPQIVGFVKPDRDERPGDRHKLHDELMKCPTCKLSHALPLVAEGRAEGARELTSLLAEGAMLDPALEYLSLTGLPADKRLVLSNYHIHAGTALPSTEAWT